MGFRKPCRIEVSSSQPRWSITFILLIVCLIIIVALVVTIFILSVFHNGITQCSPGRKVKGRDMEAPGLFSDLTPKEMRAVRDYLLKSPKLGLTSIEHATVNSSYIYMIDLQVPLKTAVLDFVDNGKRKPGRAAIAVLYRGDMDPPRVEEHLVGPLPVPTYSRLVTNPAYRRTPIPFASRPVDQVEQKALNSFLKSVTSDLYPLLQKSYGLSHHNCTPGLDCILLLDLPPRGLESGDRQSWFWAYRHVEGAPLHPLGLALQVNHLSVDVRKWSITRVLYNGQMFYEVEDLMDRYKEESLRHLHQVMDIYDQGFSSFTRRGSDLFNVPGQGPRFVEPQGRRFSIEGQFAQYFGWSFNFRNRCATGIQLFDVNFQGTRIAYEISLQEAAVFFSGHSPEISSLAFYASSWQIGASSFELIAGVDCPATAVYLDSFYFVDTGSPKRYKNSVCIFELNLGTPLRRHYTDDGHGEFVSYGGAVAHALVLRTIAVIWNQDNILDYVFHLDGTLEIRVSSTGYLLTTYSLPRERPFGHLVHDDIIGNIHQHVFHFKIDVDVAGSSNRYETLELYSQEQPNFWYPAYNTTKMHYKPQLVKTERESIWNHRYSPLKHHIIYNHKIRNKYQSARGYRIIHKSPTEFVLKDSVVAQAAGWADMPLVVTKYKDIEDISSSIYAQGDPWDPVLDFSMYLEDNNTIVDQDLVIWATLGGTVIPRAEDVPSPTSTLNVYNLFLTPYNYFNSCPSSVLSDVVHITNDRADQQKRVDTFGTSSDQPSCLQQEASLDNFQGKTEPVEE